MRLSYLCDSKRETDLVAQLAEHLTFNQRVLGSIPSEITENRGLWLFCCKPFLFD